MVIIEARNQKLEKYFDKQTVTDEWLKDLVKLSVQENGASEAVDI